MKRIENIDVPVDLSENYQKLVDHAFYMTTSLSAQVHFLHVAEVLSGNAMLGMPMSAEFMLQQELNARTRMDVLADDLEEHASGSTGPVINGEPFKEMVKIQSMELTAQANTDISRHTG